MDHCACPTEEEQFAVYRDMAERAGGKEVIIRTLDIGGDKQVGYMDLPVEANPFLGCRAIRLCLDRPEIFDTQLRAILRASVYGDIKIMFPMITSLDELLAAKTAVRKSMDALAEAKIPFNRDISLGIMIETPAAVFISDQLAENADFFSIGSNDLIQYITAADRMNEKVQYLSDSCSVAVLRAIRSVAENAKNAGIPVAICGETASEERLVPLWVVLGITELSVVPARVGCVKHIIRHISSADAGRKLAPLFDCTSAGKARTLLDETLESLLA
jgi:phosphotransferase system enzyme I (PtsI)